MRSKGPKFSRYETPASRYAVPLPGEPVTECPVTYPEEIEMWTEIYANGYSLHHSFKKPKTILGNTFSS